MSYGNEYENDYSNYGGDAGVYGNSSIGKFAKAYEQMPPFYQCMFWLHGAGGIVCVWLMCYCAVIGIICFLFTTFFGKEGYKPPERRHVKFCEPNDRSFRSGQSVSSRLNIAPAASPKAQSKPEVIA